MMIEQSSAYVESIMKSLLTASKDHCPKPACQVADLLSIMESAKANVYSVGSVVRYLDTGIVRMAFTILPDQNAFTL